MKKSRFFIGNIVKKSYKTYKEPIVFMLGGTKEDSKEKVIVKENALLYRSKYGFVDVEDMVNNFDLVCEYIMKNYMGIEYFDYLRCCPEEMDNLYVDRKSLISYYPDEEKKQETSIAKVRRLAFNDSRVNIRERK